MYTRKYHLDMKYLKEEKIEKLIQSQINRALNKFVIRNKKNIDSNLGEKLINE